MKKLLILSLALLIFFSAVFLGVQAQIYPVGNSGKVWICHANLDPAGNPYSYTTMQVEFPEEYAQHLGSPAFPAPHQYDYDGKCV